MLPGQTVVPNPQERGRQKDDKKEKNMSISFFLQNKVPGMLKTSLATNFPVFFLSLPAPRVQRTLKGQKLQSKLSLDFSVCWAGREVGGLGDLPHVCIWTNCLYLIHYILHLFTNILCVVYACIFSNMHAYMQIVYLHIYMRICIRRAYGA